MPSAAYKTQRIKFKQAHLFAKNINDNTVSKAAFALKIPAGKSVYRWAVKEYMKGEL